MLCLGSLIYHRLNFGNLLCKQWKFCSLLEFCAIPLVLQFIQIQLHSVICERNMLSFSSWQFFKVHMCFVGKINHAVEWARSVQVFASVLQLWHLCIID